MEKLDTSMLTIIKNINIQPDAKPPPPPAYLKTVTADTLHTYDLIKRGQCRYIIAGEVPCNCAEGYVFKRIDHKPMALQCPQCSNLNKGLNRLQRAHLPNDAFDSTLETYIYDSPKQQAIINDVISSELPHMPPSLFMYGKSGNGKSTISYIIAKHLALAGYRVKYIHHYDMFQKEKQSWSTNSTVIDSIVDNVDILLLDEFGGLGGRGNYSEWFTNTTVELIGILYEKYRSGQLCIILTSNLTPKQIFSRLLDKNDMALSRLQNIFGNPLHMQGPDRRAKGNQVSNWI
jgi:DNA replication protein DnaC